MSDKPVLFLDIDGVLNTIAHYAMKEHCHLDLEDYYQHLKKLSNSQTVGRVHQSAMAAFFCPKSLYHLKEIIVETGCEIVISSTWRRHADDLQTMKDWFRSDTIKDAIIDKTPDFRMKIQDGEYSCPAIPRGLEIKAWLNKHRGYDFRKFAVLDDDGDSYPVQRCWVITNGDDGISSQNRKDVVKLLKEGFKYPWEEINE